MEKTANTIKDELLAEINSLDFKEFRFYEFSLKLSHKKLAPGTDVTGKTITRNGYING